MALFVQKCCSNRIKHCAVADFYFCARLWILSNLRVYLGVAGPKIHTHTHKISHSKNNLRTNDGSKQFLFWYIFLFDCLFYEDNPPPLFFFSEQNKHAFPRDAPHKETRAGVALFIFAVRHGRSAGG